MFKRSEVHLYQSNFLQNPYFRCFDYFRYHSKGSLSMAPLSTLLGRRTFYYLYGRTMERKVDVLGLQI